MDIRVFEKYEVPIALGAIRGIDAEPTPHQDRFLEAIARLHGMAIDPRDLPRVSAEVTARIITDPHRRKRLLQLAMVNATIDGSVERAPAASVAHLAAALGVDEDGVATLTRMAAHQDTLARLDLLRRVGGRVMGKAWKEKGWAGVREMIGGLSGTSAEDGAMLRRYNRLGLLPEGTFGRALWEHWVTRDFNLPGMAGGFPEAAIFHDLGHVLSGYDTDPEGEIQQAAFQAGFVRNDGFMFLFFGIAQFHLGMRITPVAEAERGLLDVDKVMTALSRGASCTIDLSDGFDMWPYVGRPLDEVRAELQIPPLETAGGAPAFRDVALVA
jgi:hypothetical protein